MPLKFTVFTEIDLLKKIKTPLLIYPEYLELENYEIF